MKGLCQSFLELIIYKFSKPFEKNYVCVCVCVFKSYAFRTHDCYNFYILFLKRDVISFSLLFSLENYGGRATLMSLFFLVISQAFLALII